MTADLPEHLCCTWNILYRGPRHEKMRGRPIGSSGWRPPNPESFHSRLQRGSFESQAFGRKSSNVAEPGDARSIKNCIQTIEEYPNSKIPENAKLESHKEEDHPHLHTREKHDVPYGPYFILIIYLCLDSHFVKRRSGFVWQS